MNIQKAAAHLRAADMVSKKPVQKFLKLKGLGFRAADVLNECARQNQEAVTRRAWAVAPSLGTRPWGPGGSLPKGTPAERQLARADRLIRYHLAWMRDAAAGSDITIKFGEPSVTVTTHQDRSVYRGRYKGWAATGIKATVTVPQNWFSTVYQRHLVVLDGLLTLSARWLERVGDADLYAATWMERGRGYSARAESGVIARTGADAYHGTSAASALRGLARKRSGVPAPSPKLPHRKRTDVVVSLADVQKTGACWSGIRNWCHSTGLSDALDRGWATIGELAPAYERMPARELRAAVVAVVRGMEA